MVGRMVEIAPVADEAEEQLSLDAHLETWPHERFGLPGYEDEPMRRLNEQLGFGPAIGRAFLRGPLA